MIALTCPHCGKPTFGRTDTAILERLQAAQEPMTAEQLLARINVTPPHWQTIRMRLNKRLRWFGYTIANHAEYRGGTGHKGRYRLQKIEEA